MHVNTQSWQYRALQWCGENTSKHSFYWEPKWEPPRNRCSYLGGVLMLPVRLYVALCSKYIPGGGDKGMRCLFYSPLFGVLLYVQGYLLSDFRVGGWLLNSGIALFVTPLGVGAVAACMCMAAWCGETLGGFLRNTCYSKDEGKVYLRYLAFWNTYICPPVEYGEGVDSKSPLRMEKNTP